MSSDVAAFGKLKKIDLNGLSIEEKCKEICTSMLPKAELYEFQKTYRSWKDCLTFNFDEYLIVKDQLFEIDIISESDDDPYFCKLTPTDVKDEYFFAAHYYNGGCSLNECLEEEVEKVIDEELRLTSEEWQKRYPNPRVVDADGWDRSNFEYSWRKELITLDEYKKRVRVSSVIINR